MPVLVKESIPISDRNLVGSVIVTLTRMARMPTAAITESVVTGTHQITASRRERLALVDDERARRIRTRHVDCGCAGAGGFLGEGDGGLVGGELGTAVDHDPGERRQHDEQDHDHEREPAPVGIKIAVRHGPDDAAAGVTAE